MRLILALLLGCLLLGPTVLQSQEDDWKEELRDKLKKANANESYEDELKLIGEAFDALEEDDVYRLEIVLEEGSGYVIQSVCDSDCDDLDLYLYAESGEGDDIASDTEEDNHPVIKRKEEGGGTFTLEVYMVTCNAAPCRFAVAWYTASAP